MPDRLTTCPKCRQNHMIPPPDNCCFCGSSLLADDEHAKSLRRMHRKLMREWAMLFRDDVRFARQYREYHPAVYERWLIKAGENVAKAKEARDESR